MQCPFPYYKRDNISGKWLPLPCGKCEICLDNRRKDWFVRIVEEMRTAKLSLFITLTYDPDNIPVVNGINCVSEHDVTTFFKRLRKRLELDNKDISFRYFLASEYGSQGLRPHYHCCFFADFKFETADDFIYNRYYIEQIIREKWGKGFVDIGLLRPGGVNYVTKYIHKKKYPPPGATPTFQRQSKGLGISYITSNILNYHKSKVIESNHYTKDGVTYRLPRYYREKIYNNNELIQLRLNYEKKQNKLSDEEFTQYCQDPRAWRQSKESLQNQIKAKQRECRRRLKMSSGALDE